MSLWEQGIKLHSDFSEVECEWRNTFGFASFCMPTLNVLAGGSC